MEIRHNERIKQQTAGRKRAEAPYAKKPKATEEEIPPIRGIATNIADFEKTIDDHNARRDKLQREWYVKTYGKEEGNRAADNEAASREQRQREGLEQAKMKEEMLRRKIDAVVISKESIKRGQCYTKPKVPDTVDWCVGCGSRIHSGQRAMLTTKGLCHAAGGLKPKDSVVIEGLNCLMHVQKMVRNETIDEIRFQHMTVTAATLVLDKEASSSSTS